VSKYFFSPEALENGRITVSKETSHHLLNVLRMKPGDEVILCDGNGMDYLCAIESNFDVFAKGFTPCITEPFVRISLYQSLPKGDKFDLIVQKCVELGVYEIYPVHTERSVSRIKEKDTAKKTSRFQKISEAAAGQSMRGIIPVVHPPCDFKEAIKMLSMKSESLTLLAYEQEHNLTLKAALNAGKPHHINIWIGPEGGFSDKEVAALREVGAIPVTLGRRILRTETAAISAIAQIICLCEDEA